MMTVSAGTVVLYGRRCVATIGRLNWKSHSSVLLYMYYNPLIINIIYRIRASRESLVVTLTEQLLSIYFSRGADANFGRDNAGTRNRCHSRPESGCAPRSER